MDFHLLTRTNDLRVCVIFKRISIKRALARSVPFVGTTRRVNSHSNANVFCTYLERTDIDGGRHCAPLVAFSRTVVTFLYTLASMKTYIPTYVRQIGTHMCAKVPLEYRTNYIYGMCIFSLSSV